MLNKDYKVILIKFLSFKSKLCNKVELANVNSPIPGFSTKIVPNLHGFTLTQYFQFPKISVIRGPPVDAYRKVMNINACF